MFYRFEMKNMSTGNIRLVHIFNLLKKQNKRCVFSALQSAEKTRSNYKTQLTSIFDVYISLVLVAIPSTSQVL